MLLDRLDRGVKTWLTATMASGQSECDSLLGAVVCEGETALPEIMSECAEWFMDEINAHLVDQYDLKRLVLLRLPDRDLAVRTESLPESIDQGCEVILGPW